VKSHIVFAILSGALLSSFSAAQAPPSRFDISGNLSYNGAILPTAPSSTQVRGIGWQSSGVTRLSRWMSLTSQFGAGYASSDSIQLIGYTGAGTMRHYSMLVGPRITVPTRGRLSPFVEGLVGADRASTDLVSNGTSVTGSEIQMAYAVGGGTQINLSKHFGLNFEGEYFATQHTIAYTGWQPSHLQFAAGIVFRMFGRGPQIAEQHPLTVPNSSARTQPGPETTVTRSAESEAPGTTAVVSIQSTTPNSSAQLPIQPQTVADANMPVASKGQATGPQIVIPGGQVVTPASPIAASTAATQPATAVPVALQPSPSQPAVQTSPQASRPAVTTVTRSAEREAPGTTAVASIQSTTPNSSARSPIQPQTVAEAKMPIASTGHVTERPIVIPGGQVVTPARQIAASTAATRPAAPVTVAMQANPSKPAVQTSPQASRPAATTAAVVQQSVDQTQLQPPPISLGEYARRLREKKQQQSH
jgi:hypothetical protein